MTKELKGEKKVKEEEKRGSKSQRQLNFENLIIDFGQNGFTKHQAIYLIKLLDSFIPLI